MLSKKIQKYLFILITTILSCFYIYFFLYFERRLLGISSTYHPDSLFYYNNFKEISVLSFKNNIFENLSALYNSFFSNVLYPSIINLIYEFNQKILTFESLSFFHQTLYRYIVKFNIILYLILNFLIIILYFKKFENNYYDPKNVLFLLILLFLPYRCHLTVSILKDSLILFSIIVFLTYQNIYSLILSFVLATPFRFGAIIYYILFLDYRKFDKKILIPVLILTLLVLMFLFFKIIYNDYDYTHQDFIISIKEFLKARNNVDLGGRSFDEVPNFFQYKIGSIIRAATWPFLFISGGFVFFTKNYLFYILAIEIIFVQIIFYYFYKKSIITINLILILIIIGIYTNTFTSYFRYSYIAFYISILISFLGNGSPRKIKEKLS